MKRILLLSVLCSFLISCATVRSENDFDDKTYEKKSFKNSEILGTVTVSTLGFTWESLSPTDRKAVKLMDRLENKALKQYGNNIDIINVEIGGTSPGITTPLWVGAGVGMTVLALAGNEAATVETTNKYGQKETTTDSNKMMPYSLGVVGFGSLFFFKGIKAEAVVIRSDTPYKKNPTGLLSDEDIELRRKEYTKIKASEELNKKRAEELADKENVPPFIFSYKNNIEDTSYAFIDSKIWITDNFKSGKDVIQMEDKDYGIIMGKAKDDEYWFTFKIEIKNDSVTITFYDYYRDKKGEIYEANTHTEWNYFSQRTTVIAEKYFRTISQ